MNDPRNVPYEGTTSTDPNHPRGMEPSDPNYRGSDPNYNMTNPNDRGTDPASRSADPNYRGTDQNYRGTDQNYRGTDQNYRGSDPNHPGTDPAHRNDAGRIHRSTDMPRIPHDVSPSSAQTPGQFPTAANPYGERFTTPVDHEAVKINLTNLANQIRNHRGPAKDTRSASVALIEEIADRFIAVQGDAAQVNALAMQLRAAAGGLGAAVVAGS